MLALLLSFASTPAAAAEETDQTVHATYLAAVKGVGTLDGSNVVRVVARTYNSANSGTNDDIELRMSTPDGDTDYALNTSGDNLERNHIDVFWFRHDQAGEPTVFSLGAFNEAGSCTDWYQSDSMAFTDFRIGRSVGLGRTSVVAHTSVEDRVCATLDGTQGRSGSYVVTDDVDVYALRMVVADTPEASTSKKVRARLVWADGERSDWLRLDNPWLDDFERDAEDLFFLPLLRDPDEAAPVEVEVKHEGGEFTIEEVELVREVIGEDGIALDSLLDVSQTLAMGDACGGCAEWRSSNDRELELQVETGTKGDAGTDSKVWARATFADGTTGPWVRMDLAGDNFEEKAEETFPVYVSELDLGNTTVDGVELKMSGSDGWRPRRIKLVDPTSGSTLVSYHDTDDDFLLDGDCDADVTDDCAPSVHIDADGALSEID